MTNFFLNYTDLSLILLRIVIALIYGVSGWSHLKDPAGRAKGMGLSKGFVVFIGLAEVLGAIALILGILTQWAALGLIIIGFGAIYKKIFEWHTEFWGTDGYGWHYDLMLIIMNLVILTTAGGAYLLF